MRSVTLRRLKQGLWLDRLVKAQWPKKEGRGLPSSRQFTYLPEWRSASNGFHLAQAPATDLTQKDQPICCARAAIDRALTAI